MRILLLLLLAVQLCAAQTPSADFAGALWLCDYRLPVRIEQLPDAGRNLREATAPACAEWAFPETNTLWLRWETERGGELRFTLMPLDPAADLDFVLYRLEGSADNAAEALQRAVPVRCMYAGANPGESAEKAACTGATGLSVRAADVEQALGCRGTSDNFLAPVQAQPGEQYALFVHNYHNASGLLLEFSGDCTFRRSAHAACATSLYGTALQTAPDDMHCIPAQPNPATDRVAVQLTTPRAAEGHLLLTDAKGRTVQQRTVSVTPGTNTLETPLNDLPAGIYFMHLTIDQARFLSRFVKQ